MALNEPGPALGCLTFGCIYTANARPGDPTYHGSASVLKFCSMHPCRQLLSASRHVSSAGSDHKHQTESCTQPSVLPPTVMSHLCLG